jgi:hypothetical protein
MNMPVDARLVNVRERNQRRCTSPRGGSKLSASNRQTPQTRPSPSHPLFDAGETLTGPMSVPKKLSALSPPCRQVSHFSCCWVDGAEPD